MEPAGARISAGKSGKVEMSFPAKAEVCVNWAPTVWEPSPELPAIITVASLTTCLCLFISYRPSSTQSENEPA